MNIENPTWKVIQLPVDAHAINHRDSVVFESSAQQQALNFMRHNMSAAERKGDTLDLLTPSGRMSSWVL